MWDTARSAAMGIDLGAVRHNLARVRELAGGREVIASVKANAYGLGVVAIARELKKSGVRRFWTGNIDEAIQLKASDPDASVLMFGGYHPSHLGRLIDSELEPTIYDPVSLNAVSNVSADRGCSSKIWLKVNSGLGRLGVALEDAIAFVELAYSTKNVAVAGIYTHLAFGSPEGKAWAMERYLRFCDLLEALDMRGILPATTQVWGSAGLLANMPDRSNSVCVGHLLYGLSPADDAEESPAGFLPAVTSLSAPLINLTSTGASQGSYGTMLRNAGSGGTIGIGLSNGLRRPAAGQNPFVLLGSERAPVQGFSLEHMTLDLSGVANPVLHETVTLIGGEGPEKITLADWARWSGCKPLEMLISLSGRLPIDYANAK